MNIAIAGYGVEGEENYRYWAADSANNIVIADESDAPKYPLPEGVGAILGEGAFQKLDGFDLVVRTASLPPFRIKTDGKIWSATNEFFAKCPAPIIGVTGTKGKGTTSSIIAALFEASGRKVWLVGNIGIAALSVLSEIKAEDIVVFELSSFQLWDIETSPHTAVVLLIEPDHLNVHKDMEDYVHAKGGIARYQKDTDLCVYHPTNLQTKRVADESVAIKKIRYAVSEDGGVFVADGFFRTNDMTIAPVDALQLRGDHNKDNACAAITVAINHGLSNKTIEQGLRNFKGLPHRLEEVRTLDGVEYYNDSFSSAPAATIAAVKAFENPEIVVIGGTDKGSDFSELSDVLKAKASIKEIVLIGEIRHKLKDIFLNSGVTAPLTIFDGQTMPEIVTYLHNQAVAGDVVILSPACASFDMFRDFYDRGTQFREEVLAL